MKSTRRVFLRDSAAGLLLLGAGCGGASSGVDSSGTTASGTTGTGSTGTGAACPELLEGGTFVMLLPFVGEMYEAVGERTGSGLDGRLALDLTHLTPATLITANEDFYIRTMVPGNLPSTKTWPVRVHGLVGAERSWSLGELLQRSVAQGVHLLECSGNSINRGFGLMSAADFEGVALAELVDEAGPAGEYVRVVGFDDHTEASESSTEGAEWVFRLEDLRAAGAFLATHMNGAPLPPDHGFPLRLVVPGWFGCCAIKWVTTIEVVDEDTPATSQMQEFASRTHQSGVPSLARDYAPALVQQAAMVTRVELWELGGHSVVRLLGVHWGGSKPLAQLQVQANAGTEWHVFDVCPVLGDNRTWGMWEYVWDAPAPGRYALALQVVDDSTPAIRLDQGTYTRTVDVPMG